MIGQAVTCDAQSQRNRANGQGLTPAQRQAAYRARKGTPVQVFMDPELLAELDAYIERQHQDRDVNATRSSVIAKLVRSSLLRKR